MTASVLQEVEASQTAGASTIAKAITYAKGSFLHVIATCDSGNIGAGAVDFSGCADGGTNTYTLIDNVNDASNNQRVAHWWAGPTTSSGTVTVTVSFTHPSGGFEGVRVKEIGSCSAFDKHAAIESTFPGTGANIVSTGATAALAAQPALASAFCFNTSGGLSAYTAGTTLPWVDGGAAWTPIGAARSESLRVTSTSAITATFGASASVDTISCVAVFTEASGALAGSAGITFGESGAITGAGATAGNAAVAFGEAGAIAGAGALLGTSALLIGENGTILGSGALAGSSAVTFGESGQISASGSLGGSAGVVFGESGAIAAAGALLGSAGIVIGESGAIAGAGAAAGSAAITFGATGTPTQTGLSGSASISFGETGSITGAGALHGTLAVTFGESGVLAGAGVLAAAAAIHIGAVGSIAATGSLAGIASIVFSASGSLAPPVAHISGVCTIRIGATATPVLPHVQPERLLVASYDPRRLVASFNPRRLAARYDNRILRAQ